jgi:enterobactin synthetase component D
LVVSLFRSIPSPPLFPPFVAQHSVVFDYGADVNLGVAVDGIELPAELNRAVPKRKLEFLAGRHCARQALRALAPRLGEVPIAIAKDHGPVWPAGVVGSITHSRGFASAAVALIEHAFGLGLDSEILISPATLVEVAPSIATVGERRALVSAGEASEQLLLTVVFSAKEAIFKCLHRHVAEYFDFLDAEITSINLGTGLFAGRLLRRLTEHFPAGLALRGRVAIDGARAHTSVVLVSLEDATAGGPLFY